MFKRQVSAAVVFGVACFASAKAQAGTIQNYSFTQGGWTGPTGEELLLQGTFAGNIEANGSIQNQDLASFQADFKITQATGAQTNFLFNLGTSTGFYYNPSTGQLSFSNGSGSAGIELCSGAATGPACLGLPTRVPSVSTSAQGFFEDLPIYGPFTTMQGATVVNPASTTATPEPKSMGLIATAGLLLLAIGGFRRQRFADAN